MNFNEHWYNGIKSKGSDGMLTKLTLGEKLKDLRIAKGYKSTEHLASIVNIPKTTLNDYENDEKNQDVGYANLITLAKFYEVSMDYLLGLSDVDRHLNTAYSDLGLGDKTIDLLKKPKFNIRLLNELIEHEHFADFMADMEIYIDGLATMQITTLNSVAEIAKDEITGEYAPNDKEYFMRTLQSAKIKEDRYFHAVIHEDIDRIADDLRILHSENKKDTQVVSDDTGGLSILIELIQKLKDFKGTPQEIKLKLFTLILGTDINRLNKQEKAVIQTLIKKGEMTWKKS